MGYGLLTLDTRAPLVTWGSVQGNYPGGALTVGYTLDEPGIVAARLIDFDGVIFPLTVEATRLVASLPDTVALGQATVEVDVEDDVLNAETHSRVLAINAYAPPVITPQIVGGIPRETPPHRPAVRRTTSRVRAITTSRAIAKAIHETRVEPVARYRALGARSQNSVVAVSTLARQTAHLEVATTVAVSSGRTTSRDDSQIALLALLLD